MSKKWYRVSGTVTVSAWTYVEARSPEEAVKLANQTPAVLCPFGPDRHGENPIDSAIIEDADGTFVCDGGDVREETPAREYLEDAGYDDDAADAE